MTVTSQAKISPAKKTPMPAATTLAAARTRAKTKTILCIGIGLIGIIWTAVIAALVILAPPLKTKLVILAIGAGSTELVLYAGAAWCGINVVQHIRRKWRARRG